MIQYIVYNRTLNSWFMQSVSSDINVAYRFREWIAKDNPEYEYVVSTMDERAVIINRTSNLELPKDKDFQIFINTAVATTTLPPPSLTITEPLTITARVEI